MCCTHVLLHRALPPKLHHLPPMKPAGQLLNANMPSPCLCSIPTAAWNCCAGSRRCRQRSTPCWTTRWRRRCCRSRPTCWRSWQVKGRGAIGGAASCGLASTACPPTAHERLSSFPEAPLFFVPAQPRQLAGPRHDHTNRTRSQSANLSRAVRVHAAQVGDWPGAGGGITAHGVGSHSLPGACCRAAAHLPGNVLNRSAPPGIATGGQLKPRLRASTCQLPATPRPSLNTLLVAVVAVNSARQSPIVQVYRRLRAQRQGAPLFPALPVSPTGPTRCLLACCRRKRRFWSTSTSRWSWQRRRQSATSKMPSARGLS